MKNRKFSTLMSFALGSLLFFGIQIVEAATVVYPSGDPETDYTNIMNAIAADTEVVLAEGVFIIPRSIVVENPNLDLSGSGLEDTFVTITEDFEIEVIGSTPGYESSHLFTFPYDDGYPGPLSLSVSNMTIVIDHIDQDDENYEYVGGIYLFNQDVDYNAFPLVATPVEFTADIFDLHIQGEYDSELGNSARRGISLWGPEESGDAGVTAVTVQRVSTQNVTVALQILFVGDNATAAGGDGDAVVVGGSEADGCSFLGSSPYPDTPADPVLPTMLIELLPDLTMTHVETDGMILGFVNSGAISHNHVANATTFRGAIVMFFPYQLSISENEIENIEIQNGSGAAILVGNGVETLIVDNEIQDVGLLGGGDGIALQGSNNGYNIISGNELSYINGRGIRVINKQNMIEENELAQIYGHGMFIRRDNNEIRQNELTDVLGNGLIVGGRNNVLEYNDLTDIGSHGVLLQPQASGNAVRYNELSNVLGVPAIRDDGTGNTVEDNEVK